MTITKSKPTFIFTSSIHGDLDLSFFVKSISITRSINRWFPIIDVSLEIRSLDTKEVKSSRVSVRDIINALLTSKYNKSYFTLTIEEVDENDKLLNYNRWTLVGMHENYGNILQKYQNTITLTLIPKTVDIFFNTFSYFVDETGNKLKSGDLLNYVFNQYVAKYNPTLSLYLDYDNTKSNKNYLNNFFIPKNRVINNIAFICANTDLNASLPIVELEDDFSFKVRSIVNEVKRAKKMLTMPYDDANELAKQFGGIVTHVNYTSHDILQFVHGNLYDISIKSQSVYTDKDISANLNTNSNFVFRNKLFKNYKFNLKIDNVKLYDILYDNNSLHLISKQRNFPEIKFPEAFVNHDNESEFSSWKLSNVIFNLLDNAMFNITFMPVDSFMNFYPGLVIKLNSKDNDLSDLISGYWVLTDNITILYRQDGNYFMPSANITISRIEY